jgi:2-iminobutanoate/2-iminopropanoate deaminase
MKSFLPFPGQSQVIEIHFARGVGLCYNTSYFRKAVIRRMKPIKTPNAPLPAGHYTQAMVHNGLVFVSGQLPVDPKTGEKHVGSIEEQTSQALQNVAEILEAAGSGLDQVIKATVYISDISLWERVNTVYAETFGEHRPARAIVPTRSLHFGFQIEIEVVAAIAG